MPLTDPEKQWVAEWLGQAGIHAPVFPADLAPRMPQLAEDFRGQYPATRASDPEIVAVGAASVYGPGVAGVPPDSVITELVGAEPLTCLQTCDSAVARGCLRPLGPPDDWSHCWLPAWETLFAMIRSLIQDPVAWFGVRIGEFDAGLRRWKFHEAGACAAVIRGYLVRGCTCCERDADFHAEDGEARCATEHSLQTFNPTEQALRDFLWRAANRGQLRLPDDSQGEVAHANSARKGILPRIVSIVGDQLVAGPTLKCNQPGCKADIELHDRCTNGHDSRSISDVTWWFWRKNGQRGPWHCRRCLPTPGCDGLYFQDKAVCPCCGEEHWSAARTFVWVRPEHLPPGAADLDPLDRDFWKERDAERDEVLATLSLDAAVVARALIVDGASKEQARDLLTCPPTDAEFMFILEEIAFVVSGVLFYGVDWWKTRRDFIGTLPAPGQDVGRLAFLWGRRSKEAAAELGMVLSDFTTIRRRIAAQLRKKGLLN